MLPSRSLVPPAADDDIVMSKRTYEHVLVLPGQRVVHPAADDDFAICVYVVQVLNMCELP